jgi:hypothetical protein
MNGRPLITGRLYDLPLSLSTDPGRFPSRSASFLARAILFAAQEIEGGSLQKCFEGILKSLKDLRQGAAQTDDITIALPVEPNGCQGRLPH